MVELSAHCRQLRRGAFIAIAGFEVVVEFIHIRSGHLHLGLSFPRKRESCTDAML